MGAALSTDGYYGCDNANRVTSFTEPGQVKSQAYGYDAVGNMWQTSVVNVPALLPTGPSWYLLNKGCGTVRNRLKDVAYDAAGNQQQLSALPGTTASYDGEGRVSRIEVGVR